MKCVSQTIGRVTATKLGERNEFDKVSPCLLRQRQRYLWYLSQTGRLNMYFLWCMEIKQMHEWLSTSYFVSHSCQLRGIQKSRCERDEGVVTAVKTLERRKFHKIFYNVFNRILNIYQNRVTCQSVYNNYLCSII